MGLRYKDDMVLFDIAKDNRISKYAELVKLSDLFYFCEYDRRYQKLYDDDYIDELSKSLKDEGIKEEVMLEYNPSSGYAAVGEGNHRIMIARELGVTHIPLRVYRNRYTEPPTQGIRGGAYIKNPKILTGKYKGHINQELKPSEVFDTEDFYDKEEQFMRHVIFQIYQLFKDSNLEDSSKLIRFLLGDKIKIPMLSQNTLSKIMRTINNNYILNVKWDFDGNDRVYEMIKKR